VLSGLHIAAVEACMSSITDYVRMEIGFPHP